MLKKKRMLAVILFAVMVVFGSLSVVVYQYEAANGTNDQRWSAYEEHWTMEIGEGDSLKVDLSYVDVTVRVVDAGQLTADFTGSRIENSKDDFEHKVLLSHDNKTIKFTESPQDQQDRPIIIFGSLETPIGIRGTLVLNIPKQMLDNVDISAYSGNIDVNGFECYQLSCNSSGGKIQAENIKADSEAKFDNYSGDVEVLLPDNAGFLFELVTYSGEFEVDFAVADKNVNEDGESMSGRVGNSAQDRIFIETSSGDIAVRPVS